MYTAGLQTGLHRPVMLALYAVRCACIATVRPAMACSWVLPTYVVCSRSITSRGPEDSGCKEHCAEQPIRPRPCCLRSTLCQQTLGMLLPLLLQAYSGIATEPLSHLAPRPSYSVAFSQAKGMLCVQHEQQHICTLKYAKIACVHDCSDIGTKHFMEVQHHSANVAEDKLLLALGIHTAGSRQHNYFRLDLTTFQGLQQQAANVVGCVGRV